MDKKTEFEILELKDIEICRDLCDELMAYQKSKATISPKAFDSMNFDTRMKKSCEDAIDSQIIVCMDKGVPTGYVFSTIEAVDEMAAKGIPSWAEELDLENCTGFYPDWLELPQNVGCLNNIYLKDGCRGGGIGLELLKKSLDWFKSFPKVEYIFVYISNGNDDALKFYLNNGFELSHEVFNGFITAAYRKNM